MEPVLQITTRLDTAGQITDGVKFFVTKLEVQALKLPKEAKLVNLKRGVKKSPNVFFT